MALHRERKKENRVTTGMFRLTLKLSIWLIASSWNINTAASKDIFAQTTVPSELLQTCSDLESAENSLRDTYFKIEALESKILACASAMPACPERQELSQDRVALSNRIKLEQAKMLTLGSKPTTVSLNLFSPEVLFLVGTKAIDLIAASEMDVTLSGPASEFSRRVQFESGKSVNLIDGLILTSETVRDSDPLGDFYRLKAVWNHVNEDALLSQPDIKKAVEKARMIASGRQISLRGYAKEMCDLANNPRREIFRVAVEGIDAKLAGISFDVDIKYAATLSILEQYPHFDWLFAFQEVIESAFGTFPPTANDIQKLGECSTSDAAEIQKKVEVMRQSLSNDKLLGNTKGAYDRVSKAFSLQGLSSIPIVRISLGDAGLLFAVDTSNNLKSIGYSEGSHLHFCE